MIPRAPAGQPPKLLDRVRAVLRMRHYRVRTEEASVSWLQRFILGHGPRHPRGMGGDETAEGGWPWVFPASQRS